MKKATEIPVCPSKAELTRLTEELRAAKAAFEKAQNEWFIAMKAKETYERYIAEKNVKRYAPSASGKRKVVVRERTLQQQAMSMSTEQLASMIAELEKLKAKGK